MAFVIDTGRLDVIRQDIGYSCIPQITSAYNTVVSIRTNLPSKVLGKKWINSNLRGLYRDIDNINDDLVKIQNLLYKAVEKMNEAERRSLYWNSLKSDVVSKGRAVVDDIKDFGSDLYNDYEAAKDWFGDKLDKVYETGAEVFEKVSNWVEDLTWEDVKDFFKTTGATIVVALESLTKGLLTLLQAIVDLVYIAVAIVGTVFTGISDGVNYILTGESGGYTKALWDDTMALVAEVGTLTNDCCNWITDNNPDWINEYSLIEAGGVVDEIIQGIGYMVGIIGISVATFGAATPVALAVTAGTLGFAKSTAEHWEEGKDAASGLLLGAIDGGWEALQYYVGGKIGTSVFGKITSKIANPILQKLAVSGLRITADSLTGAVEVPFQSAVAMIETRVDDIDGNELSWDEAWNASGGWIGVIQQTAIAGLGSLGGEVIDFGKAGIRSKKNGSSFGDALNDIYIDDINTAKLNSENPLGRFSKKGAVPEVDISDNIDNQVKNSFPNDSIDDGAIAMANYRANKGIDTTFRFEDASNLPDLDNNFWKNIDHPEQTFIYVDGKNMTFDEALIYKQSYTSYSRNINMGEINNLNIKNLNYADVGMPEAAAARLTSNAKRYIYNDTNDFIGLNSRIADNGLYHFTDAPDAILNSGYIKATGEKLKGPLGYLGPAYGNAKTFFFEGIPDVGAFATNLDDIPLKTTAIKINPTSDILDSSKLRIRNLDDGAITWDGRFNLLDQNPTKQYFVLTVDNGKLKYMNVPESIYNSYDNSTAGKQLSEFLSNKKNIQAIKDDYLVNSSLKSTNAKVSNNITHTSIFDKSKDLLKNESGFIDFSKFKKKKVVDINLKDLDELAKVNLEIDDNLARFNSARVFSDDLEVSIEYGDAKQYLFHKLKKQAEITHDPQLIGVYKKQAKLKNVDKSFDELYMAMYDYLDDVDVKALSDMLGENINFTKYELDTIYAYSRVTGPTLTALERGVDTQFVTTKGQVGVMPGSNKNACQRLFDDQRAFILGDYSQIKIDDAIATMDNVIKKSPPLKEDTILYRGVNNVFFDGKKLDITDLKPGQIINDKATISTSLLKDKAYAHNDIMLEILAPKGTKGAYIESFVGAYGQQEFLLGRNTKFKVLDNPITDPITGKTTIKVEIVSPDNFTTKLRNTGSNIISNFDSKAKRLFGKGNVTAELNDNIGTGFVKSSVTVELTDNYPNKFVNKKSSNIIDKMNLRDFKMDDSVTKYNYLFNKFDDGLDVDDFVDNLKSKGLLEKFDIAINDIDDLYSRPPGPGVVHHDVSHVERVMLFAMDMGDKLKLSDADMDLLVDAAKYHDVGVYGGHGNHALRSADEALKNLQGKYSEAELRKIAAIIECHEIDDRNYVLNNLDNSPAFMDILDKYNIPQSERDSTIKIINILKDADAIDRTRFRNNLNTNYFRNTNEANNLVKTSYEMQEIYGKLSLDNKIKNNEFTATQIQQINNYRNIGIPDYVIEQSYATYNMWGNAGRRLFNTPDEMIRNWMQGAGYQF